MVIFLPLLGAIADYTHLEESIDGGILLRRCHRAVRCFFFVTDSYVACSVLLIVANMTFAAANVFYNAS
jgi:UMF1 family MFS transporter